MSFFKHNLAYLGALCALLACGESTSSDNSQQSSTTTASSAEGSSSESKKSNTLARGYAEIALANYKAAHADALTLNESLKAFTEEPNDQTLEKAKKAWLNSRDSYGQTEVFRFIDGPIDNESGPEGQLNAWPLDEAHIDYVRDASEAGIINKVSDFPEITQETLIGANENPGEKDISTGYHAIEFLLWGQDDVDPSNKKPGMRPVSDYVDAPNAERRKTYLLTLGDLLVQDLESLVKAWETDQENYRKNWETLPDDSVALKMMRSMGSLAGAELAGERMAVALENGDQEDEHSCFSDNTHKDIIQNMQGIYNLWIGEYGDVSGTGLKTYVEAADKELAATIHEKMQAALKSAKELPVPFDYAISLENTEGRAAVQNTIDALRELPNQMDAIAQKLNLELVME